MPPRGPDDAGEVDLIAFLDGHLLVIEVKSTFMRRSQRDAWLHATTTLRKAGQQLRRKVEAVSVAIASDPGFRAMLGLAEGLVPARQHVWIADTCIECDHQRFGGFLKVSVEELLIALRDDRHRLNDPAGLLAGSDGVDEAHEADASESGWSLYPDGFSAERFVKVIETEAVWDVRIAKRGGRTLPSIDSQEVSWENSPTCRSYCTAGLPIERERLCTWRCRK